MTQCLALSLQILFWLAVALIALPLVENMRQRWLGASLAGAFARECRRRRLGSISLAGR